MNKKVIPETERNWSAGWLANRWIDWRKNRYVEKKMLERERENVREIKV